MARDFENIHDIDDLSDDDLRDLVRDWLGEQAGIDADDITVTVEDGLVRLGGRVGTEAELRIAEHLVTDSLGLTNVENEIVVDALRRRESPMAVDDHLADEEAHSGLLLGDRTVPLSDEVAQSEGTLDEELFGTTDVQSAISQGTAWIPPMQPTPEGLRGTDAGPAEMGEDH